MLANANFCSFYCKTWCSEYSKWLQPVASPDPLAGLRSLLLRGSREKGEGKGEVKGREKGVNGRTASSKQIPGAAPGSRSFDQLRLGEPRRRTRWTCAGSVIEITSPRKNVYAPLDRPRRISTSRQRCSTVAASVDACFIARRTTLTRLRKIPPEDDIRRITTRRAPFCCCCSARRGY